MINDAAQRKKKTFSRGDGVVRNNLLLVINLLKRETKRSLLNSLQRVYICGVAVKYIYSLA